MQHPYMDNSQSGSSAGGGSSSTGPKVGLEGASGATQNFPHPLLQHLDSPGQEESPLQRSAQMP